jgi:hypothetical protein
MLGAMVVERPSAAVGVVRIIAGCDRYQPSLWLRRRAPFDLSAREI